MDKGTVPALPSELHTAPLGTPKLAWRSLPPHTPVLSLRTCLDVTFNLSHILPSPSLSMSQQRLQVPLALGDSDTYQ